MMTRVIGILLGGLLVLTPLTSTLGGWLRVAIRDADTKEALPARVYLQDDEGVWYFVATARPQGSAVPYDEQWVPMDEAVEKHTTVSAHPFHIHLEPGTYRLTVERGQEYLPWTETIEILDEDVTLDVELERWSNVSRLGWFSGETHVHRRLEELPNVMLAEDLNVAFPVTFWTTRSDQVPDLSPSMLRSQGPSPWGPRQDAGFEPLKIDATHVIYPRNTEYEIFAVGDQRHTLGALFILNHRNRLSLRVPPVKPVAQQAHAEGALLDLDKHNWPWSLILVAIADIDLYELSNNSVWKTTFGFRQSPVPPAEYMQVEQDEHGITERGWLQFGFETYYALLNCGFRLQPTAGTASGVHPVPLGFGRVYVQVEGEFSGQSWLDGLRSGRSFVTTGPMLLAKVNGRQPGYEWKPKDGSESFEIDFACMVPRQQTLDRIEILVNGEVIKRIEDERTPRSLTDEDRQPHRFYGVSQKHTITLDQSSWIALRAWTRTEEGRPRFAHTAPWYVTLPEQPLLPRREQIAYLREQVERELQRSREILNPEARAEFQEALDRYREIESQVLAREETSRQ